MEQATRNKLRNVVTQCRKLLEESIAQQLEGQFGIRAGKKDAVQIEDEARMSHLSDEDQQYRRDLLDHLEHIKARSFSPKDSLDQLIREIAFTHLNRLCAYKMMEAREVYVGGQKFRECVSRGINSNGFKFYLADHPDDERFFNTGDQETAYRHFLDWVGGSLSEEIGVLFHPNDPANRLYPRQTTLDELLDLLNDEELAGIWEQDESIGWVYQYFTPKELRDKARSESRSPRNSYELAFRNQFFTPRYVVEFLTDNTLGRIWYEMRKGDTKLKDQCRYMVRRPNEIFLDEGQEPPENTETQDDLSQEELLKQPVHIPHRPKKDPRELKILDPACGSGHFLLYCFDLLLTIYEEAYNDPDLGPALQKDYPNLDDLRRDVPRLILAHNLHGIDIDLRCTQIAALALWLRCQRAYQETGLKKDRPKITRSNLVCAEPMPGEEGLLKEFVGQLEPKLLGQLVEVVFDRMTLAGEAGSLLKIEEEIREAVALAKKQWLAGPVAVQRSLFDKDEPKPRQQQFDLAGISDDDFFEQAQSRVVEALRQYAEKAQNGKRLQRRLFADDAMRGFAFVDLCHKQFDTVLMNPPFGSAVSSTTRLLQTQYADSKNDLYACFIERGWSLCQGTGLLGAITSRVGFFASTLSQWRERFLLGDQAVVSVVADLGHGVLDAALVEAAAYVLQSPLPTDPHPLIVSTLDASEKGDALATALNQCSAERLPFFPDLRVLRALAGCPLAYWLPPELESALKTMTSLNNAGGKAAVGLQTDDDFRFLRLHWEVSPKSVGRGHKWSPVSKGGEYAPFFDDLHLLLLWEDDGDEIKRFVEEHYSQWSRSIRNVDLYFTAGLTYPERTTSDFSPRPLPSNAVFSIAGPAIFFADENQRLGFLGFAYSRIGKMLLEVFIGLGDAVESGSAARHYRTGILNALPLPSTLGDPSLCCLVMDCLRLAEMKACENEASLYFVSPSFARTRADSLAVGYQRWREGAEAAHLEMFDVSIQIDTMCAAMYGLTDKSLGILTENVTVHPSEYPTKDIEERALSELFARSIDELVDEATSESTSRHLTKKSYFVDRKIELLSHIFVAHPRSIIEQRRNKRLVDPNELCEYVRSAVMYSVGIVCGRWNVELVLSPDKVSPQVDPFCPLPACSPGMLTGVDGLPVAAAPESYPLRIDRDGIVTDDPGHEDDIVRRVREVLEVIWKDRADVIEKEACEILGVKSLRDYFRKPSKGGFWDDHVKRYSKSRRKAPIYWLLQSSKKNYALWLYYHRLDKDMLFKALLNYVEPKIQREDNRLAELRSQKSSAGDSGKAAKKTDRDIEKQEDLLTELRDFEEKLRKVADMHLDPDLNDGVVLNIAPLHELVPWKEAKKYWNELMDGKYEWSSIGKQLREKGLVK